MMRVIPNRCERCGSKFNGSWGGLKKAELRYYVSTNIIRSIQICQSCHDGFETWFKKWIAVAR